MNHETQSRVITSQEKRANNARNRQLAKFLLGAVVLGGASYGLGESIEEGLHKNNQAHHLSVYDLGNKPVELNKLYKEEHSNPLDYTFKTIEAGESDPTYVAKEMGAIDVNTVADEIDVQTSVVIDGRPRNSMHPGQVIVVAKEQLKQP